MRHPFILQNKTPIKIENKKQVSEFSLIIIALQRFAMTGT